MQELLYQNSRTLSRQKVEQLATEVGLDVGRFRADIDSGKFKSAVTQESREAAGVGATGTPASFINGRFLSGAQPFERFKSLIDEELKKAGG
jgi:predicted DsbA family dithiol-disulfide isomerase